MEEDQTWEEIQQNLGIFMVFYGPYMDNLKLKEKRKNEGKTLPFDDDDFVNRLTQGTVDSYPRKERRFLASLRDSLNRSLSRPRIEEVREELEEIIRAKYSMNFETAVTGDAIQQGVGEVTARSGDYLLKGGLNKLLERIELKDGQYQIKE